MQIKKGEIVYLLTYHGEGTYRMWFNGKLIDGDCSMAISILEVPGFIWWAQIRNSRGQVGWTNETINFDNKDACG